MANRIRTGDPRGFNKGRSSKFREGSRVRQTPEEGRRTYWPKRCGNNNKDEDNCPKTLNNKNQQASSQKFRQQTAEEGRGTYRPKRCGNNNKDEDNSPKTFNDKNSPKLLPLNINLCDSKELEKFVYFKWRIWLIYFWFWKISQQNQVDRVFAHDRGELGSIQDRVIPNTQKNGTWYLLI